MSSMSLTAAVHGHEEGVGPETAAEDVLDSDAQQQVQVFSAPDGVTDVQRDGLRREARRQERVHQTLLIWPTGEVVRRDSSPTEVAGATEDVNRG